MPPEVTPEHPPTREPFVALGPPRGAGPSSDARADALMERYATGDDTAFPELNALLAPRVYRFLRRQVRDEEVASDLAQQVFLKLHRARGRFRRGAAVTPWVFAIARRCVWDYRRGKRRWYQVFAWDAPPDPPDPRSSLAHELEVAAELEAALEAALRGLPARQRVVFECVRLDGLTLQETAEVTGATVAGVKSLMHRALTSLHASLEAWSTP